MKLSVSSSLLFWDGCQQANVEQQVQEMMHVHLVSFSFQPDQTEKIRTLILEGIRAAEQPAWAKKRRVGACMHSSCFLFVAVLQFIKWLMANLFLSQNRI